MLERKSGELINWMLCLFIAVQVNSYSFGAASALIMTAVSPPSCCPWQVWIAEAELGKRHRS
jgi:hypothetical protein